MRFGGGWVSFHVFTRRDPELNYVGAKLLARKEMKAAQENPAPAEAAVAYYREFMDASLQRHLGVFYWRAMLASILQSSLTNRVL